MSTLRESYTSKNTTTNMFRTANNVDKLAFKFTASAAYELDEVKIFLLRVGTTDLGVFYAKIYTDNSGEPSTTQVGGNSDGFDFLSVATTAADHSILWTSSLPSLSNGTVYWVVLDPSWTTDNANYIKFSYNDAEGTGLYSHYDKDAPAWTAKAGSPYHYFYGDPAAGVNAPTGTILGALYGPLGGPV